MLFVIGIRRSLAHRPGLDGIRALAVTGVFLYHGRVGPFSGGFLGVDVFFVLSGFLITSLLLREQAATGGIHLGHFWTARMRRLLPAALVVIASSLLVTALFFSLDLPLLRGDALASALYINNWHQILDNRSYFASFGRPSLLQHFWSLAIEEQFYLLWPPLLLLGLARLSRRTIGLLALIAALVSGILMAVLFDPHADHTRIYYGTDTRAMPILIGVALAFVWPTMWGARALSPRVARVLSLVGGVGLLIVAFAMTSWTDYDQFLYRGGLAIVALGSALLIASASHPASLTGKLLGATPLVWIGSRSYGIYLWHWPVMALTRPQLDVHVGLMILVPAQAVLTIALAHLSYRYVELPIRRRETRAHLRRWLAALAPPRRRAVLTATPALSIAFVAAIAVWPAAARRLPGGPTASAAARATPAPIVAGVSASQPRTRARIGALRPRPRGPVLAIGASVMLEARADLERRTHARVDAAVSRQPFTILLRLQQYRARHALPPVVVVQTGENGPVGDGDLQKVKLALKGVPHVVIVNLRYSGAGWIDRTNRQLARLVVRWPQATLADWNRASGKPNLLWDGAHPNPRGQAVYAETVAQAIRW